MKRSLLIFMLCVYALSATGATFYMHFCGDRLLDVSVFSMSESRCCKGKMPCKNEQRHGFSKKCCHNEVASLKVKDKQLLQALSAVPKLSEAAVVCPSFNCNFICGSGLETADAYHSPPDSPAYPVYLVIRNFRI